LDLGVPVVVSLGLLVLASLCIHTWTTHVNTDSHIPLSASIGGVDNKRCCHLRMPTKYHRLCRAPLAICCERSSKLVKRTLGESFRSETGSCR
jgi:hypothetical protein